jgi:hypothetical protein
MLTEIGNAAERLDYYQQVARTADAAGPVPSLLDDRELGNLINRLESTAARVSQCAADCRVAVRCLEETAAELRAKTDGALCPVCGSPFDADRMLAGAAFGLGGHAHA